MVEIVWSLNPIYTLHITVPLSLFLSLSRLLTGAISMRFMCAWATLRCIVRHMRVRVTTCRLHQRHFRVLQCGSPLLRTNRVLSYGTHDPFPLTITPLLSSRLTHTSSPINSPSDRPQWWERYTHLLRSRRAINVWTSLLYALRGLTRITSVCRISFPNSQF